MSVEAGLARLNALSEDDLAAELLRCCGSRRWARRVAASRPFGSVEDLHAAGRHVWEGLGPRDRREAFAAHPEIGGERKVRDPTREWSRQEQSSMDAAGEGTRDALAVGQRAYRERFGYIFLIRATGRTPEEMLSALRDRLGNGPAAELGVASEEQWLITELRLSRLLEPEGSS